MNKEIFKNLKEIMETQHTKMYGVQQKQYYKGSI